MTAIARRLPKRAPVSVVILAVVIVALAASTGVLFFHWQSQQGANSARSAAVAAASQDVPALLSYSFSSFSSDLSKAEAGTTPQFRRTYGNLMTSQIEPAAKRDQVVTAATVSDTSVITAQADSATLLMFLSQQTKTNAKTESVLNDTAVRVVMRHVNGTWLVDSLTPHP